MVVVIIFTFSSYLSILFIVIIIKTNGQKSNFPQLLFSTLIEKTFRALVGKTGPGKGCRANAQINRSMMWGV